MSDELPPEFVEGVTQPWVTQQVGRRKRRRRSRKPWLVCCVVAIVLLAVLLYLFSGPTSYHNCPTLAGDAVARNTTGTLSPSGNMATPFQFQDYTTSGCSPEQPYVSGWIGFSGCGSGACRGNLVIYTASQYENASLGPSSPFVWCYPETASNAGTGSCSAYSGGGFSFTGFPAPELWNSSTLMWKSYVLVLTSAGLSESCSLTLTVWGDWTPPAP